MIYCYARTSTGRQDSGSQVAGVNETLRKKGLDPDNRNQVRWIVDNGTGGTVPWRKRGLGKALRLAKPGDTILAPEISRLARSLSQLFDFVQAAHEKGVIVETVKDGYRLDGSMPSKMVLVFMGLAAEMERELLVQRTREGLERARREGKTLGRPRGSKKNTPSLRELMERFLGSARPDAAGPR